MLDKEGRVCAFLAGRPGGPDWGGVSSRASEALQRMRLLGVESGAFSSDDLDHRRGNFLAVASGVSFGGGQTVCLRLSFEHVLICSIETRESSSQQEAPSTH